MSRFCCLVLAAMLGSVPLWSTSSPAQEVGTAFVPDTAVISARNRVASILNGPDAKYMPIEIIQAAGKQNFGIDPMTIVETRFIVAEITDEAPPLVGMIFQLREDYDLSNISPDLLVQEAPQQVAGREVYVIGNARDPWYAHSINSKTLFVSSAAGFEFFINAPEQGSGPLAKLITANPMGDQDSQTIIAVEPARKFAIDRINELVEGAPPELQQFNRVPELLDAIILSTKSPGSIRLRLISRDATGASEVQQILEQSLQFGRALAINRLTQGIEGDDRVTQAQRAYLVRMVNFAANLLKFEQENKELVIEAEIGVSAASAGLMVGLLLPAVQAAREAARRMTASNHQKQLALAFHNYHAAYKRLPPPAILDDEGNRLLSWRVAILPFIEQQQLYKKFHLDEPWDSEHNIKLLNEMPEVYEDPSLPLAPGQTVFQAMVGAGFFMEHDRVGRFRDVLDGLSNTIMLAEVHADQAVTWTKPQDLEIDIDDPISQMGHIHQGGFHVTLGDGAVIFITHSIDPDLFRAMLTRAGKEPIAEQLNQ